MLLLISSAVVARGTYQEPAEFISQAFAGRPPEAQVLWLIADRETEVSRILGHSYQQKRVRYWKHEARSAWVLEEIGKEEPITTGIIISAGRIEQVRVLIYRESRGGEVRHDPFTQQYRGATLKPGHELDRHIDGISGATLSVQALTRLARLALYLDSQARKAP